MGQQYIETLGMHRCKKKYYEYSSEYGATLDRDSKELSQVIAKIVFNQQDGIFYYEPASREEAHTLCERLESKLKELRKKYKLPDFKWEMTMHDIVTDKEYRLDWTWVMFPNGKTGYRLEYLDKDAPFTEDLGTLLINKGKLEIVQW